MARSPLTPEHHPAEEVARLLQLAPLPQEGGFFRRTAEAADRLPDGRRAWSTILALITPAGFSALHRLASDEIWSWQAGDPLESLRLHPDGHGEWVRLGLAAAGGGKPQDVIAANVWQGTRLMPGGRWALVSCVVVPEFTWQDFLLGDRTRLQQTYPDFKEGIAALTRLPPPA